MIRTTRGEARRLAKALGVRRTRKHRIRRRRVAERQRAYDQHLHDKLLLDHLATIDPGEPVFK